MQDIENPTAADRKRCRWCGGWMTRHEGESRAAFRRRKTCDRSCAVSLQNHRRARGAS